MKCPNCGAQIQEGKLYCEKCGREIQIVPEFEPEIENSIHTSLSNVATEITAPGESTTEEQSHPDESREEAEERESAETADLFWPPGKKQIRMILAFVLIGLLSGGIYIALQFMPGYQYSLGASALREGRYRQALPRLERAGKLSPNNVSYLNALASCYYSLEEYEASEELCRHVIELEGSNEEAYRRLILILEKEEAYQQISELLRDCQDREIRNLYTDYLAAPPEFDVPGGTYYEKLSVKLISNTTGTIYYTLDGSEPDENSEIYTTPIPLEAGRYTIRAFLVNGYGIRSDIAQETYYVDVHVPDAPAVSPASGEYSTPTEILVQAPEDCRVFYTTDTTDPGPESTPYEGPVWMPSGYSVFRFVTVSPGGVRSGVTEVSYTLDLHPVLTTEAALNRLLLSLRSAGELKDLQGNLEGKKGRNIYTYKYPLVINDNRYYFYREYYEEAEGVSNATGRDYVVNYISGECYEAVRSEDGSYRLLLIEAAPEDESAEAETEENEP